VVVVGSGFGGSVAALRLTEKGYRVAVLEAGRRFGPDDFGRTSWNLRRWLYAPRLGLRGIQRLTLLDDALVLTGAGVGGGSLAYANVLADPLDPFWGDPAWAGLADWRKELEPHYATARRMLGAAPVPWETAADRLVGQIAGRMSVADTHRPVVVGVHFGEPGREVADPYFGGAGPPRRGCVACGNCMIGCRHNAKNTVDRNYLWLAERGGAEVFPEREAVDLIPLAGGGREVVARRPGLRRGRRERFRARQVVVAAGVLGTLRLLFAARRRGRLPRLSPRLGERVRTNHEALVAAAAPRVGEDFSRGLAIGSVFRPAPDTAIEPVRYGRGSNAMALIATLLPAGGARGVRAWLRTAASRPRDLVRSLSPRRWSERTVILLVMQARDVRLRVTAPRARLRSAPEGPSPTSSIPEGDRAARIAAELLGGTAGATWTDVLLGRTTTAHILGGVPIGASPDEGVVDAYGRVFGCEGLVVDGSTVSANLGANPALTILALAERVFSYWPARGDPDPRPVLAGAERVRSRGSR
jgi:cholesterol oxidase